MNRFAPALVCLTWLTATTALAQPAPAATPPAPAAVAPLTVQAAPDKVIKRQTSRFVQSYAAVPNPELDQIGRWRDPVCIEVVGQLQADQAAMIKARIEDVARAVGLRAALPGCHTNIEIAFTDHPQRTMDMVAKRREYILGYYHVHETNRLKTVTHPIQSWYVTYTSTSFGSVAGMLFGMGGANPTPAFQTHVGVIDDPWNQDPAGCASRLNNCYTSGFNNVFIVADSKALEGQEIGLVADYMVMLALSQPKSLDGCNPILPSVIDRFAKTACSGGQPPDGLTPADAAYLTALYGADLEFKKVFEQGDIARRMADILIKANVIAPAGAGSTSGPPAKEAGR